MRTHDCRTKLARSSEVEPSKPTAHQPFGGDIACRAPSHRIPNACASSYRYGVQFNIQTISKTSRKKKQDGANSIGHAEDASTQRFMGETFVILARRIRTTGRDRSRIDLFDGIFIARQSPIGRRNVAQLVSDGRAGQHRRSPGPGKHRKPPRCWRERHRKRSQKPWLSPGAAPQPDLPRALLRKHRRLPMYLLR